MHLFGVKLQWTVCAVQDSDERNKKINNRLESVIGMYPVYQEWKKVCAINGYLHIYIFIYVYEPLNKFIQ
jgi:hypothetical protein